MTPDKTNKLVQNAPERKEYASALHALKPILHNLPPRIIAIDGRAGVGKTTLGRFLAWRFNVSLLETDLFLCPNQGQLLYRNECVSGVIEHRQRSERPIIIEGVVSLRLLKSLRLIPDYHIHVVCDDAEGSSITESEWEAYVLEFDPKKLANLILELPVFD